jgi:hypothetical protein
VALQDNGGDIWALVWYWCCGVTCAAAAASWQCVCMPQDLTSGTHRQICILPLSLAAGSRPAGIRTRSGTCDMIETIQVRRMAQGSGQ